MVTKIFSTLIRGAATLPKQKRRIRIVEGTAWFSQGPTDIFLEAGDEAVLNRRQRAVISQARRSKSVTYELLDH